jgi:hypothetical protein
MSFPPLRLPSLVGRGRGRGQTALCGKSELLLMLRMAYICAWQVDAGRRSRWITPCKPQAQLGDTGYPSVSELRRSSTRCGVVETRCIASLRCRNCDAVQLLRSCWRGDCVHPEPRLRLARGYPCRTPYGVMHKAGTLLLAGRRSTKKMIQEKNCPLWQNMSSQLFKQPFRRCALLPCGEGPGRGNTLIYKTSEL